MRQTKATEPGKSGAVKRAMGRRRKVEAPADDAGEAGFSLYGDAGEPPPTDPQDPGADPDDDFALDDDAGLPDGLDPLLIETLRECAALDPNDRDNGRRLVLHYGGNLAYVQGMGWLVWEGKFWQRDDGELAARLMAQNLVDRIKLEKEFIDYTPAQQRLLEAAKPKRKIPAEERSQADKELIINADQAIKQRATKRAARVKHAISSGNSGKTAAMLQQAASHRAIPAEELDSDRMRFNVRNGTLVFSRVPDPDAPAEGEGSDRMVGSFTFIEPHDRTDMITKMADVDYDPDARCPFFEAFLAKLQPDRQMQIFLQVFHAYALLIGGNDEQKVLYHYGTGANGKSAFIEVLGRLAGSYRTVVSPETITGDTQRGGQQASPDIARLHNARLATIEELPRNAPLKEELIKALSGGTKMTARFLQKEIFEFEPIFTPVLSGNFKPSISGSDYGIWRRVLIVLWGVTIPEGERMIPSRLAEKLDAERSGILNWLLDGLVAYLGAGLTGFIPAEVTDFTTEYRQDRDNVGVFADQCISREEGQTIQAGPLHKLYIEWCELNGVTAAKQRSFGERLGELGFKKTTGRVYVYQDIVVDKSWRISIDREVPRDPKSKAIKDTADPGWTPAEGV
ncbi:phage/plasmid primase, P4 family [Devosia ginsengisoli]|uniref:DNA primase family protein n=1 Tax=Devosia ginsengisoli TaxID=400770 RepID=UPI0026F0ACFF|nr:DNA primase family protein [Devosia ginsengisoli]MCR6672186.1 phage/plasmid primase, P4 family [Devosia ginsengisoli]